jgi:hypothetical protein
LKTYYSLNISVVTIMKITVKFEVKIKGKFHPITSLEDAEGE